ncbi:prolyl oligopeptidase family serine peptidase [uncultured Clostridium sp.]|uniref:prolyl oligopeptidase family serine peptidase n=1 Tax=uncultured Clostridium sp. TaxID=59620 RepID=UPI002587935F|nr:prolyl oligopeptidase family serine peptidase [uncultured Clostridium sp.]
MFLHGSGSDDTSAFNNEIYVKLAEEHNAIIAAPFARGTSHGYCPKECLEDIVEITNKLASIFSFDENQIFLCGFSMGGYGVLRVYDYCPQIFYGIIMLSGHYNIPSMFSIEGGPNYLEEQNIIKFSKLPMIIFHGRKDMNCSYEEMITFINKIQKINPRVCVDIDDDIGHSDLNFSWYKKLGEWLNCNYL